MKTKKSILITFLAPTIFLFALIYLVPVIVVFVTSLCDWKIGKPISFVGVTNYLQAFADKNVQAAMWHTLLWVVLQATVHVFLGTLLAFILARKFLGWKFFRTVCMLPNVISTAALSMILLNVFKADGGLLNGFLSLIFGKEIQWNWYFNTRTALPAVTIGWLLYPGLITILMLSAIANVPMEIVEAAKVDGATSFQINVRVVLPAVRNMLGTSVIVASTSMLREFELIYLTTEGGPGNATLNMPLYIYKTSFLASNYGYSNAMSVLLIFVGVLTVYAVNRLFRMNESDY